MLDRSIFLDQFRGKVSERTNLKKKNFQRLASMSKYLCIILKRKRPDLTTDDPAVEREHHGGPVGQDHGVVARQPVSLTLAAKQN